MPSAPFTRSLAGACRAGLAPGVEGFQDRDEAEALLGEPVLDAGWGGAVRAAGDQTPGFQPAQPLDQDFLADARHPPAQRAVAVDALLEVRQHHRGPLAADHLQRQLDRAGEVLVVLWLWHGWLS